MNKFLSPHPICLQTGAAFVRIITGFFLVFHGWELFSPDKINEYHQWNQFHSSIGNILVYAGKAAELAAGILFVIGYLTRIACILTAGVMSYIAFQLGNGIIWYNDQHPFLFVVLALLLFCTGPGKWSMDALILKMKKY